MARSLRIKFEGALYHVFSRGQRREAIFVEDRDRERFMELLAEMVNRGRILILECAGKSLGKGEA
jgi:REP element-mobilizing transposase RayT